MAEPGDGVAGTASGPSVAIIDDDPVFASLIRRGIARRGYPARAFSGFGSALRSTELMSFDVVLLDIALSDGESGIEACKELRSRLFTGAILMVSGMYELQTKLEAFRAGADDYLLKPFELDELVARIEAVWRRCGDGVSRPLEFGVVRLDPRGGGAWVEGDYKSLAPLLYDLLEVLVRQEGAPVTLGQICSLGRPRSAEAARNLVMRLREAIGCNRDLVLEGRAGWSLTPYSRR